MTVVSSHSRIFYSYGDVTRLQLYEIENGVYCYHSHKMLTPVALINWFTKLTPFRSINYENLGLNAFRILIPKRTFGCFGFRVKFLFISLLLITYQKILHTVRMKNKKNMPTTFLHAANPDLNV